MRVAIFSNHKYDQNSFEEANRSFRHDLVFLTATLESATASLASGFPAVCVFVNDRLDAPVLAQLAKRGTKFVALRCRIQQRRPRGSQGPWDHRRACSRLLAVCGRRIYRWRPARS